VAANGELARLGTGFVGAAAGLHALVTGACVHCCRRLMPKVVAAASAVFVSSAARVAGRVVELPSAGCRLSSA